MNGASECAPHLCSWRDSFSTRRDFISRGACGLAAVLAAYGSHIAAAHAVEVAGTRTQGNQGSEVTYPLPAEDGVCVDQGNEVILVRSEQHIYAFALACPHENTALRWREQDHRFQCPRHAAKYSPDGSYISGRHTRNMDRFAIHREEQKVVVSLDKVFRSDQQAAEWESAVITL